MKVFLTLLALMIGQIAFADGPPDHYPLVKAVVRKVDIASARVSLKHEAIPNLNMPGMTMSFAVNDAKMLEGLTVGDKVVFVADEIDGEITVLWIAKAPSPNPDKANIFCLGNAPTTPKTKIEIEIRREKYSTLRYEFADGPYKGTAYINSIGDMNISQHEEFYIARSGEGRTATTLFFKSKATRFGRVPKVVEIRKGVLQDG